jgi:acetolactate synthase I/II/III large subunit
VAGGERTTEAALDADSDRSREPTHRPGVEGSRAKGGATDMKVSGAQALFKALEQEGVDTVFGIPGGAILPAYDPLLDSSIRHVLCRHEQGAGHAAEGYAHATGRVGVCIVTSGPGGCNLVTALADAKMDSVPIVAITGQVPTPVVGNDAFQEADMTGLTMPVTKHNMLVTNPGEVAEAVREAFHIASTGRPGPVLIDLPKDVQVSETTWKWPERVDLPGYRPTTKGNARQIREAVKLMLKARRPVLYVGGGMINAGATDELMELATVSRIPVVTTLMARGAFPDSHELCLGMPGMHGNYTAVTAMQKADLLVALGARFDDRVTGQLSSFAPEAKIIHADIDPAEIGKNRQADVPIVGDCKDITGKMVRDLRERMDGGAEFPDRTQWYEQIRDWQTRFPLHYDQQPDGRIKPQYAIDRLYQHAGSDTIVVSGVGQHQMWASQFWGFDHPRTWINSGGLGTMGFAVPAALGAAAGMPDRRVVAIDGDGCFQMTAQERATSTTEKIPFVTAIINNAYLGMVRQWQELFYSGRYSQVHLTYDTPDYVKLAEAYGCIGLRAEHPEEVDAVIDKALSISDQSVVIDFRVDDSENCFPMVPAGASNDEIITGPEGLKPVEDPAEAPIA